MIGVTAEQLRLIKFITSYTDAHEMPPTFEEMRVHLGLQSKSGVHRIVKALEARGRVRTVPYFARSIEVLPELPTIAAVPLKERSTERLIRLRESIDAELSNRGWHP